MGVSGGMDVRIEAAVAAALSLGQGTVGGDAPSKLRAALEALGGVSGKAAKKLDKEYRELMAAACTSSLADQLDVILAGVGDPAAIGALGIVCAGGRHSGPQGPGDRCGQCGRAEDDPSSRHGVSLSFTLG